MTVPVTSARSLSSSSFGTVSGMLARLVLSTNRSSGGLPGPAALSSPVLVFGIESKSVVLYVAAESADELGVAQPGAQPA